MEISSILILAALAVVIFQLAAQRILLVSLIKQVRMITLMMEKDLKLDSESAAEQAQLEIDIAAGKYG